MEETHAPLCYYGGAGATLRIMTVQRPGVLLPVHESGLGTYGFIIDGSQDTSFRRLYFFKPPQL